MTTYWDQLSTEEEKHNALHIASLKSEWQTMVLFESITETLPIKHLNMAKHIEIKNTQKLRTSTELLWLQHTNTTSETSHLQDSAQWAYLSPTYKKQGDNRS